ncbi:GLUCAN ENDO-13-BETA-GLUCOSIDASE BG1-RELATED-RELATED [Salix koriyanagi]|uniref:glucan endo-1,3-beta-D-glucosidase n=1 Tax=Salix koriyanagi TaxID=2511006 RepID=A0A9Q0PG84_9ROSI|nr:GLUCAN ENDO-13-BETA-GLUCOSIDASE BG1-RELATED-RELATED [Salix koriyanagi]
MEKASTAFSASIFTAIFLLVSTLYTQGVEGSIIGVNYGTVANNLPPPEQVARFLSESTIISSVRLFDTNADILRAFAHTGIAVTVTATNDQIPNLTRIEFAQEWLKFNVRPYIPATNIVRIFVGNEVISTANKLLIASLVPAMETLHTALVGASLDRRIKISTPHSLGILSGSSPPSTGKFRQGYDTHVLKPLLSFLRDTNSPFMINPYPFFGSSPENLDYALFRPSSAGVVVDENTRLSYTNMLDAQLDSVFSAMNLLGFGDVEIVISETGWPSLGDSSQAGVDAESAAQYNRNLMQHVTSGAGTPLMPNRTFETYIFALFNEDLKPGPTCERNFGLFRPDMTPVYDIGILRSTVASASKFHHAAYFSGHEEGLKEKGGAVVKQEQMWRLYRKTLIMCFGLEIQYCTPIQECGECFLPMAMEIASIDQDIGACSGLFAMKKRTGSEYELLFADL